MEKILHITNFGEKIRNFSINYYTRGELHTVECSWIVYPLLVRGDDISWETGL